MALKPRVERDWNACLQTLEGHSDWVTSVVFSMDSQRLASGSWDNTVRIWDLATGKHLQTLEGHSDGVSSVVFSADSQRLASSSWDSTVKIWDPATGKQLQTLDIGRPLDRLSFDPISNVLLSTEIGLLNLEMPNSGANTNLQLGEYTSQSAAYVGYGLSSDGAWIMKDEERVLWLPPDYRSWQSAVLGPNFAIGCHSGRVLVMKFL